MRRRDRPEAVNLALGLALIAGISVKLSAIV
jgi:hypothetical protein